MDHVVFVPLSDELLFDHPERIRGPLVPYTPGMNVAPRGADPEHAEPVDNQEDHTGHAFTPARRAHG